MLLDTNVPIGQLYPHGDDLRAAMVEVARHTQRRGASEQWASRLRFLAPDPELQYDVWYERLERYGREIPSLRSQAQNSDEERGSDEDDENVRSYVGFDERSKRLFSGEHALMVTAPSDLEGCCHYLAVSYCWQSWTEATYEGHPYTVRRDNILGSPVCPPALLKIAVALTSYKGLRLLWIDQECIPQSDPDDKATGIQAKDLVYEQAEYSVAILKTCITEQKHMDALGLLLECSSDGMEDSDLSHLIDALELIVADPWFERAWTLQEAASEARQMTLLISCAATLQYRDRIGHVGRYPGLFELDLPSLHVQINGWLVPHVTTISKDKHGLKMRCDAFFDKWSRVMPPEISAYKPEEDDHVFCDAAEALSYMRPRLNSVVADRLAIVATLCGYDVRLDSTTLDGMGSNFSIYLLTLAVLNGDLSLFAGIGSLRHGATGRLAQLMSAPRTNGHAEPGHGNTWGLPGDMTLDQLPFLDKDNMGLRVAMKDLGPNNELKVGGCLWTIDRAIDCRAIRDSVLGGHPRAAIDRVVAADLYDPEDPFGRRTRHLRDIKVNAMIRLLCHLLQNGYKGLVQHLWNRLRLKQSRRGLEDQPHLGEYSKASFGDIIDVNSQTIKWSDPFPLSLRRVPAMNTGLYDPFQLLDGAFVRYLLAAIVVRG